MANVTIHCDTEGAEIRYTVNQEGSPENGTLYDAPFSASEGDVIRAIGMKEGMENSQVAEVTISQMEDEVTRYYATITDTSSGNGTSYSVNISAEDINSIASAGSSNNLIICRLIGDSNPIKTIIESLIAEIYDGVAMIHLNDSNLRLQGIIQDGFTKTITFTEKPITGGYSGIEFFVFG